MQDKPAISICHVGRKDARYISMGSDTAKMRPKSSAGFVFAFKFLDQGGVFSVY
jgi:hypothetical protein